MNINNHASLVKSSKVGSDRAYSWFGIGNLVYSCDVEYQGGANLKRRQAERNGHHDF